jgi:hypothetical protein
MMGDESLSLCTNSIESGGIIKRLSIAYAIKPFAFCIWQRADIFQELFMEMEPTMEQWSFGRVRMSGTASRCY